MADKEQKPKSKPVNIYSHLPRHIAMFSPPKEKDMREEEEVSNWRIIWDAFRKGITYKVIIYLIIPLIIFNFWLLRWDDFLGGCHFKIGFSLLEWNNLEIKRALRLIRDKSPDDYNKVCRYVDDVELYLPCDFSAGGCFRDDYPGRIGVYTMRRDSRDRPALTAGIIVHETCHAIQAKEGRTGGNREPECYRAGYSFLKKAAVPDNEIPENWKIYN